MGARRLVLLLVLLVVPACGRTNRMVVGGTPGGGGGDVDADVDVETVSYAEDVWPILVIRCRDCHTVGSGAEQVPDMRMADPSTLYNSWFNIFSKCNPNLFRVFPGNSELSFVYNKISVPAPLCGQRMPLLGAPLEPEEQQTIRDWIDQGARRN